MGEPDKSDSSAVTAKKKASVLDDDMSGDFLSSWKSMSVAGGDDMDFNFEPVAKGKKKAFDFGMDMDFSLDDAFGKMPAMKLDMADIDFSGSPKKATKANKSGEESAKGSCQKKQDEFDFSFDFDGFDGFLSSKGGKNPSEEKRSKKVSRTHEIEKEDSPNQDLSNNVAGREDANDKGPLTSEDSSNSKSKLMECETNLDVSFFNSPPESTMEVDMMQPEGTQRVLEKTLPVESQVTEPEIDQEGERSLKKSYAQGRAFNDYDDPSSEGESKKLSDISSSCEQVSLTHEIEREDSTRDMLKVDGAIAENAINKGPPTSFAHGRAAVDGDILESQNSKSDQSNKLSSLLADKKLALLPASKVSRDITSNKVLSAPTVQLNLKSMGKFEKRTCLPVMGKMVSPVNAEKQTPSTSSLKWKPAEGADMEVDTIQPEGTQSFLEKNLAVEPQETELEIHLEGKSSLKKSYAQGRASNDNDGPRSEGDSKKLSGSSSSCEQVSLTHEIQREDLPRHILKVNRAITEDAIDKGPPTSFSHGRAATDGDRLESQNSKSNPGNKLSCLRADKKLSLLPALKVSRNITSNKLPSAAAVQQNVKSMGKFEKRISLPVMGKMVSPVNAEKQTTPTSSLKRKPAEGFDMSSLMLHSSKRLSPSESRMSPVSARDFVNEGSLVVGIKMGVAAERQSPKFDFEHEANTDDLEFALMVQSNANVERAEACAKELDNICNVLKKKHEEAKELLVRALVNNNNLLMLNHPICDEKIRMVQRFTSRLMSREQETKG